MEPAHVEEPLRLSMPRQLPSRKKFEDFVTSYQKLWWSCERSLPVFQVSFTHRTGGSRKASRKTGRWRIYELKRMPQAPADRRAGSGDRSAVPANPDALLATHSTAAAPHELLRTSGMLEAAQEFAAWPAVDPQSPPRISTRPAANVMTANFIQLLLNLPVEVTPAISLTACIIHIPIIPGRSGHLGRHQVGFNSAFAPPWRARTPTRPTPTKPHQQPGRDDRGQWDATAAPGI